MTNNKWKTSVFLLSLALLGLGTSAYYRPKSQTPALPVVTNNTTAVEVISVQAVASGGYELVMRNASQKNINGYSIGFDDGASVTSDLTATFKPIIAPGEQFKQHLPATSTISVRDVVFDDDSMDGDAEAAAQLQDRRLGIKEQLLNIVGLLHRDGANFDLEQLKAQISALPDQTRGSVYVANGMRAAKEEALLALQKLDNNNQSAGLTTLVEESNRRIKRLRAKP
jgi:hypothetical protein